MAENLSQKHDVCLVFNKFDLFLYILYIIEMMKKIEPVEFAMKLKKAVNTKGWTTIEKTVQNLF